jgi:phage repressor protein C with HTH and peptisase S24 domain
MGRVSRALLPWQFVVVRGPSMVPTLRDGDVLLVRHGMRIGPGDIVLAHFPAEPARYVVKRAERSLGAGRWWLTSDNPTAGGDSRTHGGGQVVARAVGCWAARGEGGPRPLRRLWRLRRL